MKTLQLDTALCKTKNNVNHIQLYVTINDVKTSILFQYDPLLDTVENIINDLSNQFNISHYKNYDQLLKTVRVFSKLNPRFYKIQYDL